MPCCLTTTDDMPPSLAGPGRLPRFSLPLSSSAADDSRVVLSAMVVLLVLANAGQEMAGGSRRQLGCRASGALCGPDSSRFQGGQGRKGQKGTCLRVSLWAAVPKCSKMLRVEHFRHAGVLHPRPGACDDVPQLASPWFWGDGRNPCGQAGKRMPSPPRDRRSVCSAEPMVQRGIEQEADVSDS